MQSISTEHETFTVLLCKGCVAFLDLGSWRQYVLDALIPGPLITDGRNSIEMFIFPIGLLVVLPWHF
jgi:hypothetical protein